MSHGSPAPTAITFTHRLHHHHHHSISPLVLSLTADERTRSRHHFVTDDGTPIYLQLPRGTALQQGDLLSSMAHEILVEIAAKSEPVLTVTSDDSINLLRAAYHLGNRHVSLEITPTYLRLAPDSVLAGMLIQLGLQVVEQVAPFCPQGGAYSHHH